MKTLLVLPAIARLSADEVDKGATPTERVAGAWVGFLLNGAQAADHSWNSDDEVTVDTSLGTAALHQLKSGDIVFTGRSTTDTIGIVVGRDPKAPGASGAYMSPECEANAAKACAISRTLEFLRQ